MNNNVSRWIRLRDHLERGLELIHDHAVVLMDEAGCIAGWNAGAQRLLGYTEQEALGRPNSLFFTPEDRRHGIPEKELATARRNGQAADDRWHLRRDGSRFFGSGTVAPIHDDDGALLGFVKIFRDLTSQRVALDRLADSQARYRALVSSIKDYAIFMLDADGRVNCWTTAAERIKGYTAAEIVGQPFAIFFTPDDRADGVPERELEVARERGRVEGFGWRVRKDGSRFWGEEIATAIHDASGTCVGFSKITRDVTERREAELERERLLREATEANRLKDEFLSTMSHELRTPLHAVLGWLQLLKLRNEVPPHLVDPLAVIERNARAQARLIDDLLDASRLVTGHDELTLKAVAFAGPLSAAVETVRPSAVQKNIALAVSHDSTDDVVAADPARLQQVIWNVLANAIKFTRSGGRVTATTRVTAAGIELCVTDSGVGIPPEFLPYVFDRFRQADTAHARGQGGLGLGLAIVKHLVEMHGGRITIESEGRERGTTVRLHLPRPPQGDEPPAVCEVAAPGQAGRDLIDRAVLVVDDDPDGRRLLELALSAQGAKVLLAASAADGLAAARARRPDIVLTDLSMPEQDGFSLIAQLHADRALHGVPVVAVTACAHEEDRARCAAVGVDAFLAKPVDMNAVIDTVARLLSRNTQARPAEKSI